MTRRVSFAGSVLLALVAVLAMPQLARATAINEDLVVCGKDIGALTVSDPAVFKDATRGGVTIDAEFAGNYPPLLNSVRCRWVQLISTNQPLSTNAGANTPYFDPGELDNTGDNDPFYWNTDLVANDGNEHPEFYYVNKQINDGQGITFFDEPKRLLANAPVNWEAELNLVCWIPGQMVFGILWTGNYGFTIENVAGDGTAVNVSGVTELDDPVWLTQDRLTQYFRGWTIGDPCDQLVPEPSTMALLLVGFGVAGVRRWRGRRAN
jgi:hypothetical protein